MNDRVKSVKLCYESAYYYLTEAGRCCPSTVLANIRKVRSIAEQVGWEHFEFTVDDVDKLEKGALIKLAKNYFRQAECFPSHQVLAYTNSVRSIAEQVGWEHFEFTVDDVDTLDEQARIKCAS